MPFSRSSYIKIIKISVVTIIAVIILVYIFLRSLNYIKGPNIYISEPTNGATVDANSVSIKGQAQRISNLYMNGNPITIDEKGNFNKTVGVLNGSNMITLEGKDRFGRITRTALTIFGKTKNQ